MEYYNGDKYYTSMYEEIFINEPFFPCDINTCVYIDNL